MRARVLEGMLVAETRQTFTLLSEADKRVTLPKAGSEFELELPRACQQWGKLVRVEGSSLAGKGAGVEGLASHLERPHARDTAENLVTP